MHDMERLRSQVLEGFTHRQNHLFTDKLFVLFLYNWKKLKHLLLCFYRYELSCQLTGTRGLEQKPQGA